MSVVVREDKVGEWDKAYKSAIRKALEEIGSECEGDAKELTPVDTGRLRDSITHQVEERYVAIGTNVEYAPIVEFNDKAKHKVGQAHFLRDSSQRGKEKWRDIMQRNLGKA